MNIAMLNVANKTHSGTTFPGISGPLTGKAKRNYDAMKLIGVEKPEPWKPS